jgi:iron complex outermembrane receptor protein
LAEEAVEEVVVTGLRGKPRTATDSPVPVDVFNAEAIEGASNPDMDDLMQTLVPSYNVARQPISDGASFIRPATLRGLPSHHTLVLVNGKRRHRASLVQIGGAGTQGPDLATIPSTAIQSIEVLRDGASSQYGSDAIAGVINFNLKENREGISLVYDTGEYYEGDGAQNRIQGNIGLPLGDNGFLSISGDWFDQEFTERSEQYCRTAWCNDPNNPVFDANEPYADWVLGRAAAAGAEGNAALTAGFPAGIPNASVEGSVVQPWGIPNRDGTSLFFNAGYDLDNGIELYAYGNYTESEGDGSFFYRFPGNGVMEDIRRQDGSVYSFLNIYPGGFTPRFVGEIEDYSFLAGARGETAGGLNWDVSARRGSNQIDYTLFNTLNPSLGPDTPRSFRPGDLTNEETQLQVDLSKDFDMGFYSPMTVAFGLSYLDESYEVGLSSDPASYQVGNWAVADPFGFCNADGTPTPAGLAVIDNGNGPGRTLDCADGSDPVFTALAPGSNGFPGYGPDSADKYERDSTAVYLDLSADITEDLFLQGAVRYEDYEDFGDETVGKVAARYRLSDKFAIRGSLGTGFRAPTPGQQGTTNVSTRLPNGVPVAVGLYPASSPAAQALGAAPLKPETSTNITFGFTADLEDISLTVDFYRIEIEDRFQAISTLVVSSDPNGDAAEFARFQALEAAGVPNANTIGGVNYFQNAFDTETVGMDIVATMPVEWDNGMNTNLTASVNYNRENVQGDAPFSVEDRYDFENAQPQWRGVFTANHDFNNALSMMVRGSYYGEEHNSNTSDLRIQTFKPVMFWDLEGTYRINENFALSLGGRNIFDDYPDELNNDVGKADQCCGRIYSSGTFVPWQGGYYYARRRAEF